MGQNNGEERVRRDNSDVRVRIIDRLSAGAIDHPAGRAVAILKSEVGYDGPHSNFVQLLTAMERSSQIRRNVRGKRTYSVSLGLVDESESKEIGAKGTGSPEILDYDELASALLTKVTRIIGQRSNGIDDSVWLQRIEELDAANLALQRDLARAVSERDALQSERDELRERFAAASHNIDLLTERLNGRSRGNGRQTLSKMTTEDKALLESLRRKSSSATESAS